MFTRIFLFLFAGLITGPAGAASNGGAMTESKQLIDFEATRTAGWQVVNDGVMGGRSRGHVEIDDGVLRFNGTLVTQGGGFTSVRASVDFDLSDYEGLELRVRGNGRIFEVEVNDGQRYGWRAVSRRAPFDTGDDWQDVRVPFSELRATVFGRRVDVPPVRPGEISRIGFFIVDGRDGPFWLEVDSIGAYSAR